MKTYLETWKHRKEKWSFFKRFSTRGVNGELLLWHQYYSGPMHYGKMKGIGKVQVWTSNDIYQKNPFLKSKLFYKTHFIFKLELFFANLKKQYFLKIYSIFSRNCLASSWKHCKHAKQYFYCLAISRIVALQGGKNALQCQKWEARFYST